MKFEESEIDVLNTLLAELMQDTRIDTCEFSRNHNTHKSIVDRLVYVLIENNHAVMSNARINVLGSTINTIAALNADYYRHLYNDRLKEESEKRKVDEKIELEIKKLRRDNRFIIPAFCISIISTIIALVALFV